MTVFETIRHWKNSPVWQCDKETDGQDFFVIVTVLIWLKVGKCGLKWLVILTT